MSKLSALDAAGEATNKDLVNAIVYEYILLIPTFVGAVILHRDLVVTSTDQVLHLQALCWSVLLRYALSRRRVNR